MTPYEQGAGREPDPHTATTTSHRIAEDPDSVDHEVYMFGLARRIRWLSNHRHWYLLHLRSIHRDLEDCECNGCRLDGVA